MFKGSRLYTMQEGGGPTIPVTEEQAKDYNARKMGIFFCVQGMKSDIRRIDNCTHINAWAIDLDSGTKESQEFLINRSPLKPSLIVESARGYHLYWLAKDAKIENYRAILETRLIPFFNADPNAKDVARILRMPGYQHWKNPEKPFDVKIIFKSEKTYAEKEMGVFPVHTEQDKTKGISFWEAAHQLRPREILDKLSGSSHFNGDIITFKSCSNGNENIWVNGKSTSCWIDTQGKIGSCAKGGPGIANWLYWYHRSWKKVAEILEPFISKDALIIKSKPREVSDYSAFMKPMSVVIRDVYDGIEQAFESGGVPTGITTFESLDDILWGLQKGSCYVLAARSSVGKSAFAVTVTKIAAQKNLKVLYFALESSAVYLVRRMLAQVCGISSKHLQRGTFEGEQFKDILSACDEIKGFPVFLYEKGGLSANAMCSVADAYPCDLMIVDHIQEINAEKNFDSRHHELSHEVGTLKDYCIQKKIPLLLLSQVKRPASMNGEIPKAPSMFEIKESGDIENKADVLMILHREGLYSSTAPQNEAMLRIAKNRDGETGTIVLEWDGPKMEFKEKKYDKRMSQMQVEPDERTRKDFF